MKKYNIIYADPPWFFNDAGGIYQDRGRRRRKVIDKYPTMKTGALLDLPVENICEKNALLFLWVIDSHIPDALQLMEAWGFRFSTVAFYWIKKTNTGKNYYNVGAWTMKSVEQVFLGIRGHPLRFKIKKNIKQLVEAERTVHSRKPDEIRDRIVSLCGDILRIEIFAREKYRGWDSWGNEVKSNIKI